MLATEGLQPDVEVGENGFHLLLMLSNQQAQIHDRSDHVYSTSSAGAVATCAIKSMVPRNSKALSCLRYEIASATAASTASRLLRKVPSCISVSIAPMSTSRLVAMAAQYAVRDDRQELGWSLLRRFLRRMLQHAFANLPPMSSNPPKVSRFPHSLSHSLPHSLPPDR